MKRLEGALLTIWVGSLALADAPAPTSTVAAEGERTTETLRQLERDWADAEESGDSEKICQIVADDWTGVNNDGRKLTKGQLIARVTNLRSKSGFVEFGPMEVKVLGDVAIVQGSDLENCTMTGKCTSGQLVWMDVFTKRDGKWVAVRSQSTRTGPVLRRRWPM